MRNAFLLADWSGAGTDQCPTAAQDSTTSTGMTENPNAPILCPDTQAPGSSRRRTGNSAAMVREPRLPFQSVCVPESRVRRN